MNNEYLATLTEELRSHMLKLSGANLEHKVPILFGRARLDDGTDQYRIYQLDDDCQVRQPMKGQRICFIGKGTPDDPVWMVAMFRHATFDELKNSMRINLPLQSTVEHLALQIYDYIVNGNFIREKTLPTLQ